MDQRALLVAALAAVGGFTASPAANACGGCFVRQNESTVVTGHRMAVAIAMNRSVLWDQIRYSGNPSEFSWVLPVRPGATIELAHDAWFEVLDAATGEQIQSPPLSCGPRRTENDGGGFGCAASTHVAFSDARGINPDDNGNSAVTIVHQGTVGPYETVTLESSDPAALDKWLDQHGYELPADIAPVIAAYVAERFDFIALRLIPGEGVQAMQPVRVVMPGTALTLPLRMVAAGTGATTSIELFVIGEGRYQARGFANAELDPNQLVWDFGAQRSNYTDLRSGLLAQQGGFSWLTSYARQGSLFSQYSDALGLVSYQIGGLSLGRSTTNTVADAYAVQGQANGEDSGACPQSLDGTIDAVVGDPAVFDDACSGSVCPPLPPGQIPASQLKCGALDDLAVALTDMHPKDVWLTRLEAELPRAALADDLDLEPAPSQSIVGNRFVAAQSANSPCPPASSSSCQASRGLPGGFVGSFFAILAAVALLRRLDDRRQAGQRL